MPHACYPVCLAPKAMKAVSSMISLNAMALPKPKPVPAGLQAQSTLEQRPAHARAQLRVWVPEAATGARTSGGRVSSAEKT